MSDDWSPTPPADPDPEAQRLERELEPYSGGVPYDRDRYVADIRDDLGTIAYRWIRVGSRLIVAKAHEPHGEWLPFLERVGIAPRTAQAMMAVARKFGGIKNATVAHLAPTKLIALLDLDDDEIEQLAGGEALDGLGDLDEIDRLPVAEVKKRLRARNRQIKEGMAQVERLQARIAELEEEQEASTPALDPTDETVDRELFEARMQVDTALVRIEQLIDWRRSEHCGREAMACADWLNNRLMDFIRAMWNEGHQLGLSPASPPPVGMEYRPEPELTIDPHRDAVAVMEAERARRASRRASTGAPDLDD